MDLVERRLYLLEILAEAVGDAISMGFIGLACACVSKEIEDVGPNSIVESILCIYHVVLDSDLEAHLWRF